MWSPMYIYIYIYNPRKRGGLGTEARSFPHIQSAARDEILSSGGSLSHHHGGRMCVCVCVCVCVRARTVVFF